MTVDRLLEAVPSDEPHGIIRPAVGVVPEAVDGDDPGMLQTSRHLGFEQEAGAAPGVVGVMLLDLLQRDLAPEFLVEGEVDLADRAPGMRADDSIPGPAGR